jgi:hypothetical protein
MKEKTERPFYEPPRAIDLSSMSVNGQIGIQSVCSVGPKVDNPQCKSGGVATGDCTNGSYRSGSHCTVGASFLVCLTGGSRVY